MLEEAEQQAAEKVKAAMKEAEDIIHELRSIKEEHKSFKDHELINAKKRLEDERYVIVLSLDRCNDFFFFWLRS